MVTNTSLVPEEKFTGLSLLDDSRVVVRTRVLEEERVPNPVSHSDPV
jgi:hypothetical protein